MQETADAHNIARKQLEEFSSALKQIKLDHEVISMVRARDRDREMMRTIYGPLEDLRRIKHPAFAVNDELQSTICAAKVFEDSFRLHDIGEIKKFFEQLQSSSISSTKQRFLDQQASIQNAMEAMHTPWLNTKNITRSFLGFSELQNIGSIVRNMPTFDDKIADILRMQLGDWRSRITWPGDIFENPIARSFFYEYQGLNLSLTEFPAEAFQEGLSIVGLRDTEPSEESETEKSLFDEDGLLRTNQAHDRLQRFEIVLRHFIDKRMVAAFGPVWIKQRIPGDMQNNWQKKKESAREAGEPERPLIEYADFTDYTTIIVKNDNWKAIFQPFFKRKNLVEESFQRLYPIRICTMHARIITQDDELYLYAETKRILKAIGFQG